MFCQGKRNHRVKGRLKSMNETWCVAAHALLFQLSVGLKTVILWVLLSLSTILCLAEFTKMTFSYNFSPSTKPWLGSGQRQCLYLFVFGYICLSSFLLSYGSSSRSWSSSSWRITVDDILDPVVVVAQLGIDRGDSWVAAAPAEPLHTLKLAIAHQHTAVLILGRGERIRCTTVAVYGQYMQTTEKALVWWAGALLGRVHTDHAVLCVCLTSTDHVIAPIYHLSIEGVPTSLVIHNRHSYTHQPLIRLICFGEKESVLLLGFVQISPEFITQVQLSDCHIFSTNTHQSAPFFFFTRTLPPFLQQM